MRLRAHYNCLSYHNPDDCYHFLLFVIFFISEIYIIYIIYINDGHLRRDFGSEIK